MSDTNLRGLIDNFIYLYHTDEYLLLPQYPDTLSDKLSSRFSEQNALARTAPIYAYSYSGPREVQISLNLHRDMINSANVKASNFNVAVDEGDDYVDTLIKRIQSIALPKFVASSSSIVAPKVAVRMGKDIFIKGIVNGGVAIDFKKPILSNGKYANVTLNFTVSETTPYDADSVVAAGGSFRGWTRAVLDNFLVDKESK